MAGKKAKNFRSRKIRRKTKYRPYGLVWSRTWLWYDDVMKKRYGNSVTIYAVMDYKGHSTLRVWKWWKYSGDTHEQDEESAEEKCR